MELKNKLAVAVRASVALLVAASATVVFLLIVGSAHPGTPLANLGDRTYDLIGNSARKWLLTYLVVFAVPVLLFVTLTWRTRLGQWLFKYSGVISAIAVVAPCWWYREDYFLYAVYSLLCVGTVWLMVLHLRRGSVLTRWSGILDLLVFFGFFLWVTNKYGLVPEFCVIPILGLATSLLWAYGCNGVGLGKMVNPTH